MSLFIAVIAHNLGDIPFVWTILTFLLLYFSGLGGISLRGVKLGSVGLGGIILGSIVLGDISSILACSGLIFPMSLFFLTRLFFFSLSSLGNF